MSAVANVRSFCEREIEYILHFPHNTGMDAPSIFRAFDILVNVAGLCDGRDPQQYMFLPNMGKVLQTFSHDFKFARDDYAWYMAYACERLNALGLVPNTPLNSASSSLAAAIRSFESIAELQLEGLTASYYCTAGKTGAVAIGFEDAQIPWIAFELDRSIVHKQAQFAVVAVRQDLWRRELPHPCHLDFPFLGLGRDKLDRPLTRILFGVEYVGPLTDEQEAEVLRKMLHYGRTGKAPRPMDDLG